MEALVCLDKDRRYTVNMSTAMWVIIYEDLLVMGNQTS
jgi:hypothetical protein